MMLHQLSVVRFQPPGRPLGLDHFLGHRRDYGLVFRTKARNDCPEIPVVQHVDSDNGLGDDGNRAAVEQSQSVHNIDGCAFNEIMAGQAMLGQLLRDTVHNEHCDATSALLHEHYVTRLVLAALLNLHHVGLNTFGKLLHKRESLGAGWLRDSCSSDRITRSRVLGKESLQHRAVQHSNPCGDFGQHRSRPGARRPGRSHLPQHHLAMARDLLATHFHRDFPVKHTVHAASRAALDHQRLVGHVQPVLHGRKYGLMERRVRHTQKTHVLQHQMPAPLLVLVAQKNLAQKVTKSVHITGTIPQTLLEHRPVQHCHFTGGDRNKITAGRRRQSEETGNLCLASSLDGSHGDAKDTLLDCAAQDAEPRIELLVPTGDSLTGHKQHSVHMLAKFALDFLAQLLKNRNALEQRLRIDLSSQGCPAATDDMHKPTCEFLVFRGSPG
mmetsp:Transcript_25653/g.65942  ORF Transcript_25653/g.65942 Transcript_25653/m.65942 type:complete len:440 (-) Transcript_25653:418-1737(-)